MSDLTCCSILRLQEKGCNCEDEDQSKKELCDRETIKNCKKIILRRLLPFHLSFCQDIAKIFYETDTKKCNIVECTFENLSMSPSQKLEIFWFMAITSFHSLYQRIENSLVNVDVKKVLYVEILCSYYCEKEWKEYDALENENGNYQNCHVIDLENENDMEEQLETSCENELSKINQERVEIVTQERVESLDDILSLYQRLLRWKVEQDNFFMTCIVKLDEHAEPRTKSDEESINLRNTFDKEQNEFCASEEYQNSRNKPQIFESPVLLIKMHSSNLVNKKVNNHRRGYKEVICLERRPKLLEQTVKSKACDELYTFLPLEIYGYRSHQYVTEQTSNEENVVNETQKISQIINNDTVTVTTSFPKAITESSECTNCKSEFNTFNNNSNDNDNNNCKKYYTLFMSKREVELFDKIEDQSFYLLNVKMDSTLALLSRCVNLDFDSTILPMTRQEERPLEDLDNSDNNRHTNDKEWSCESIRSDLSKFNIREAIVGKMVEYICKNVKLTIPFNTLKEKVEECMEVFMEQLYINLSEYSVQELCTTKKLQEWPQKENCVMLEELKFNNSSSSSNSISSSLNAFYDKFMQQQISDVEEISNQLNDEMYIKEKTWYELVYKYLPELNVQQKELSLLASQIADERRANEITEKINDENDCFSWQHITPAEWLVISYDYNGNTTNEHDVTKLNKIKPNGEYSVQQEFEKRIDNMQNELVTLESQLRTTQDHAVVLQEQLQRRTESFDSVWQLLTPKQRFALNNYTGIYNEVANKMAEIVSIPKSTASVTEEYNTRPRVETVFSKYDNNDIKNSNSNSCYTSMEENGNNDINNGSKEGIKRCLQQQHQLNNSNNDVIGTTDNTNISLKQKTLSHQEEEEEEYIENIDVEANKNDISGELEKEETKSKRLPLKENENDKELHLQREDNIIQSKKVYNEKREKLLKENACKEVPTMYKKCRECSKHTISEHLEGNNKGSETIIPSSSGVHRFANCYSTITIQEVINENCRLKKELEKQENENKMLQESIAVLRRQVTLLNKERHLAHVCMLHKSLEARL